MRLLITVAVLLIILCQGHANPASPPADPPPAGPLMKGDPNIEHEVHPEFPETPPPNPRSNGRWMVHVLGIDTMVEGAPPRYFVVCWINSDVSTFREVDITAERYDEFLDYEETGSIPCPG
jgi:hypothetical protein